MHKLNRLAEKILLAIVWKLPKKLVYWCAIRVMAHATTGEYGDQITPELLATDALKRWETA
jgi:hypothetical protein